MQLPAVRSIAWLGGGGVKHFGAIVASPTKELSTKLSFGIARPLATRRANSRVALGTPRVWTRISEVVGMEETDASPLRQTLHDVLTHERLRLRAVLRAMNRGCRFGHRV